MKDGDTFWNSCLIVTHSTEILEDFTNRCLNFLEMSLADRTLYPLYLERQMSKEKIF